MMHTFDFGLHLRPSVILELKSRFYVQFFNVNACVHVFSCSAYNNNCTKSKNVGCSQILLEILIFQPSLHCRISYYCVR